MRTTLFHGGLMLLVGALVGCASTPKESGFLSTYKNLQPVQGNENFLRYVAPDEVLGKYHGIIVDPVTVHFYDPKSEAGVRKDDIYHLETYFTNELRKNLKQQGFNLVATPGPGIMRLRVAFTDIKKSTPALNILPQTKLTGIGLGQASAEGELVDSVTGEQLAAAIKSETGSRFSFNSLSQWGDVEGLCRQWAKQLANRLSVARARATS